MTKRIEDFTDDLGRITQGNGNAIDSAFLTTNYYYQMNDFMNKHVVHSYVNKEGKFTRYIHNVSGDLESENWTDPRTVSRDNSIGTYICLASVRSYDKCRAFALACLKRGSFYQNTHTVKLEKKFLPDFVGISGWSILLRGLGYSTLLMYPLLLFTDAFLFINFLTFIIKNKYFDKDYNSPLFHMVSTAKFCAENMPTFIADINRHMLYRFCPVHPNYESTSGVGSQIREYSRASYDPPVYLASEKIVDNYNKTGE